MELALLSNLDFIKFIDLSGLFPALIIAIVTLLVMRFTKSFWSDLEKKTPDIDC